MDTLHESQSSDSSLKQLLWMLAPQTSVFMTLLAFVSHVMLGLIRSRIKATLPKGHGSDFSANRLPFEQASWSSVYIIVVIRHTRNTVWFKSAKN